MRKISTFKEIYNILLEMTKFCVSTEFLHVIHTNMQNFMKYFFIPHISAEFLRCSLTISAENMQKFCVALLIFLISKIYLSISKC